MRIHLRALCVVLSTMPALPQSWAQTPLTVGKVLFLDNNQVLVGDEIAHLGRRFRIRRGTGDTWIPAQPGYVLLADMIAAYRYLQQKTNLQDAKERMRLSRWCFANGLKDQAIEEAALATQLQPEDRGVRQYYEDLRRLLIANSKPAPLPELRATHQSVDVAATELNAGQLASFVTKVQPILMNACANCHAGSRQTSFRLARTSAGTVANPQLTQANVAACVVHINRENIADSKLLQKAVAAHGGAQFAPLRDRQGIAYRHLEEWARTVYGAGNSGVAVAAARPSNTLQSPPEIQRSSEGKTEFSGLTPLPEAPSTDPFDPALFNRAVHPPKK